MIGDSAAPQSPDDDSGSAGAVRALRLIDHLARSDEPCPIDELVRALAIPRSTLYQIARPLIDRGYLARSAPGRLWLGETLLDLYLAQAARAPAEQARPAGLSRSHATSERFLGGVSRSYLWNPDIAQIFDCSRFRKRPPYRIGFANASLTNHWRIALLHGLERSAERDRDRLERFIVTNADDDPRRQIEDVKRLVQAGIDILLLSCCEAEILDPIAGEVMRQGIPVVAVDRRPATTAHFVTHVSGPDTSLGRVTAQWIVEKLGGRGGVVMMAGTEGASPAEQRVRAAREVFRQHSDIAILAFSYTNWRPDRGYDVMRAAIERFGPAIAAVWCDSGLQGVGSIQAFLDSGWAPGTLPIHTGGDLNQMYQAAVVNRVPMAGLDYPPAIGQRAFKAALDVLDGRALPRQIAVDSHIVVSRGHETVSIRADHYVEDWVDWLAPPSLIMGHGLGADYNPLTFAADYPA
jgi:ribose transport system substrate-binding protein